VETILIALGVTGYFTWITQKISGLENVRDCHVGQAFEANKCWDIN